MRFKCSICGKNKNLSPSNVKNHEKYICQKCMHKNSEGAKGKHDKSLQFLNDEGDCDNNYY